MFGPEDDKPVDTQTEPDSAVVVDLSKPIEEQETPVTAKAGDDKAGVKVDEKVDEPADTTNERRDAVAEDELSDAPTQWRKRLKREIRQKIQTRADNVALSQDNDRLRAELEEARTRRPEPREEAPDTSAIDAKLDAAEKELAKAIEDGESATVAKLQRKIAELAGEKTALRVAPKREVRREEPAPRQREQQRNGPTPLGKAFTEANADWWTDPEQAAMRAAVVSIDQQLIKAGSDPNTEGHYQAIRKRAEKMGLKVKIRQPYDDSEDDDMGTTVDLNEERRTERREPPQGGNGTGRGRVNTEMRDARAGKIVLTEADKDVMRTFKLDPGNPAHLRAFAKSRQERILQEAGQ